MLTTNEVCTMLHFTSRTLYKYAELGYITRHKINQTLNMYEYDEQYPDIRDRSCRNRQNISRNGSGSYGT